MKRVRSRLSTIKFSPEEDNADELSEDEGDLSIDYDAIELVKNLELNDGRSKDEFIEG